jgi:hypothetical protein
MTVNQAKELFNVVDPASPNIQPVRLSFKFVIFTSEVGISPVLSLQNLGISGPPILDNNSNFDDKTLSHPILLHRNQSSQEPAHN